MRYEPSPTAAAFHENDHSLVKILMSAVGQGKTVTCIHELLFRSMEQAPDQNGLRKTRWLIIRSTFAELKSTTIKTFQRWIPPSICPIIFDSPIRGHINALPLNDGTFLDVEFYFLPMNRPDDVSKVLSFEFTGAYINEVAELDDSDIFKNLMMRIPRYPDKADGAECTWHGIIADMNPPPIGSWLYNLMEVDRPPAYQLYKYTSPLIITRDQEDPDDITKIVIEPNPDGENVQHVQGGYDYWITMAENNLSDINYIKRFVLGEYPYSGGGKPVYPTFSEAKHVRHGLTPNRACILLVGLDFGLNPASTINQFNDGRLQTLDELHSDDMTLEEFVEDLLSPLLRTKYHGFKVIICGDPSGDTSGSTVDRMTSYMYLKKKGYRVYKPKSNKFKARRDSVTSFLNRRNGMEVDSKCQFFIGGLAGGYKFKITASSAINTLRPEKNLQSHIQDAHQAVCQYLRDGGETASGQLNYDNFDAIIDDSTNDRAPVEEFLYA